MNISKKPTAHHSKVAYAIGAIVLIALIGYAIWGSVSRPATSSTILEVSGLNIGRDQLAANGEDISTVSLTITTKDDGLPAAGMWIGLHIPDESQASEEFTHFGWYSPEPGRSFYTTDANGRVSFSIRSVVPGEVTYAVYAANPEQRSSGKYQSLDKEFTLTFK
jgi:hypothetical protein